MAWRKSSFSSDGPAFKCVEVDLGDPVRVRDSKNPDGTVLEFSPAVWLAFIKRVRKGEFDRA